MFAYTKLMQAMAAAGVVSATDPYFNLTTLLLPGNGTNGAQNNTFIDSSTNNFTITRNGNTTQGTFSPFSQTGWSNYLASSGRLAFGINSAFDITQGDFTVEAWVNISSYSAAQHIAWYRNDSPQSGWGFRISITTGYLQIFYTGGSIVTSTSAVPLNSWVHVAACRSGGTCYLFINGTQVGSAAFSNGTTQTSFGFRIGADGAGTENLIGYISNFRLVKSGALYTSSFTPSTTPLTTTVSAGTVSLLTCQSNRFVDNSSNAFAITLEGTTTSVQAFSPFAPTAAYSASTVGGSGYFDGSGDYLSASNATAFLFGTGDFTAEAFVYPTSFPAEAAIITTATTTDFQGFTLNVGTSGNIILAVGAGGSWTFTTSAGGTLTVGQWQHIALTRSGNVFRIFVNGTQTYTNTNSVSLTNSNNAINVGGRTAGGGQYFNGYISNARILKGTAQYTANFTPPTAPLTAITNTQLLLNYTNAGITDATAKNDLETVGNAQISTTQSKFGGSSMYFDGTGDWLTIIDNPNLQMGSGDFTIEGWFYLSATGVAYGIVSKGTSTTGWSVNITSGNKLQFSYTSSNLTGATTLSSATWYYFAVVRSGTATGNLKIYLNGSADATSAGAVTDNFNQTNIMYIGADRVGGSALNGYIDDLRITKGFARTITASPTAALPLQ